MKKLTSNQYITELGGQLERYRLMKNVSQAELADRAGISSRTLRRLESGEGGSLDSLIRLLIGLGIDSHLSVLIPDTEIRPMERARKAKTERLRASRTKTHPKDSDKNKSPWVWGDEK